MMISVMHITISRSSLAAIALDDDEVGGGSGLGARREQGGRRQGGAGNGHLLQGTLV
jgi:hypothetical protein